MHARTRTCKVLRIHEIFELLKVQNVAKNTNKRIFRPSTIAIAAKLEIHFLTRGVYRIRAIKRVASSNLADIVV